LRLRRGIKTEKIHKSLKTVGVTGAMEWREEGLE
jgi:hypothetical protein